MKIPVKAKIYHAKDGNTALKAYANVSIGDVLFINSYAVSNTDENPNALRTFPPSYKTRGGYKPYIEFLNGGNNPLSVVIYKACKSAYRHYEDTGRLHEYGETFYLELDSLMEGSVASDMEDGGHVESEEDISLDMIPF